MWKINLITGIFLFVLGFIIIKFKMTNLIAGYNTSPKKEREKYDKNKLVKYIGSLLMISSLILIIGGILSFFFLRHEANIYFFSNMLFILVMIAGVIYINVSGCTKKKVE